LHPAPRPLLGGVEPLLDLVHRHRDPPLGDIPRPPRCAELCVPRWGVVVSWWYAWGPLSSPLLWSALPPARPELPCALFAAGVRASVGSRLGLRGL